MGRPLRIGVNALYLIPGGVGGTEVYLRQILRAFARESRGHQFFVFLNRETDGALVPELDCFHTVGTGVKAESRPRRILYEQLRLAGAVRRAGVDVLYNPGFTSPRFSPCPNVTLIHDLQHHRHPEYFRRADLLAWRLLVWSSAKGSSRILTVSEASREDIHAVYGVELDRIHTAEPGVEPELFQLDRSRAERMILCVSTLHPHKNIERLIDAFAQFRKGRPDYRLVLAGMRGFHAEAVERRVAEHGLENVIRLTGWIPRSEVIELYARAEFAVFPSTFEGFGIPVAEAMAAGVPLITSAVRPMTDTAGGTALLFPPGDTEALVSEMEALAGSAETRVRLAALARERAAQYTWDRAAAVTLDTLELAAR